MKNKNILRISIIISIIGIITLMILSFTLQVRLYRINQIDLSIIDKKIQVEADILSVKNYRDSDFQILTITDGTGTIQVTLDSIKDFKKNQTINIIGRVTKYNNAIQIQAEEIFLE